MRISRWQIFGLLILTIGLVEPVTAAESLDRQNEIVSVNEDNGLSLDIEDVVFSLQPSIEWTDSNDAEETYNLQISEVEEDGSIVGEEDGEWIVDKSLTEYTRSWSNFEGNLEGSYSDRDHLRLGERYHAVISRIDDADNTIVDSNTFDVNESIYLVPTTEVATYIEDGQIFFDQVFNVGENLTISVFESPELFGEAHEEDVAASSDMLEDDVEDYDVDLYYEESDEHIYSLPLEINNTDENGNSNYYNDSFVPKTNQVYRAEFELELSDGSSLNLEETFEPSFDQDLLLNDNLDEKLYMTGEEIDLSLVSTEDVIYESYEIFSDLDFDDYSIDSKNKNSDFGESYSLFKGVHFDNMTSNDAGTHSVTVQAFEYDEQSDPLSSTELITFYERIRIENNLADNYGFGDINSSIYGVEEDYDKNLNVWSEDFDLPKPVVNDKLIYNIQAAAEDIEIELEREMADNYTSINDSLNSAGYEEFEDKIVHEAVYLSGDNEIENNFVDITYNLTSSKGNRTYLAACSIYNDIEGECTTTPMVLDEVEETEVEEGQELSLEGEHSTSSLDSLMIVEEKTEKVETTEETDEVEDEPVTPSEDEEFEELEDLYGSIDVDEPDEPNINWNKSSELLTIENINTEDGDFQTFNVDEEYTQPFISSVILESSGNWTEDYIEIEEIDLEEDKHFEGLDLFQGVRLSSNSSFNNINVVFGVPQRWVESSGDSIEDVRIFRWVNDEWLPKNTYYRTSENENYSFRADMEFEGVYAIGKGEQCPEVNMEAVDPETNTCRTYTTLCDLPDNYEDVISCDFWRTANEIEGDIESVSEEREFYDEDALEEASAAVNQGRFEDAEQHIEDAKDYEPSWLEKQSRRALTLYGLLGLSIILGFFGFLIKNHFRSSKRKKVMQKLHTLIQEANAADHDDEIMNILDHAQMEAMQDRYEEAEKTLEEAEEKINEKFRKEHDERQ